MVPWIASSPSLHPNAIEILDVVRRSCSPTEVSAVQISGQHIRLPWHVVRALLEARDARPSSLSAELSQYGRVLADDDGLTIITDPDQSDIAPTRPNRASLPGEITRAR